MSTEDHKERFLRLPEVQDRTGVSRSFVYKSITDKTFSAPRKVGGRASVWLESEVNTWMSRVAGETGAAE